MKRRQVSTQKIKMLPSYEQWWKPWCSRNSIRNHNGNKSVNCCLNSLSSHSPASLLNARSRKSLTMNHKVTSWTKRNVKPLRKKRLNWRLSKQSREGVPYWLFGWLQRLSTNRWLRCLWLCSSSHQYEGLGSCSGKFMDEKKLQGKGKSGKADKALAKIPKLYGIELRKKGAPTEEWKAERQALAKLILDDLYQ